MSFLLGLGLGLIHAFEADHLAAVASLSTRAKNPFHGSLLGAYWGLGHTLSLLVVGLLVLLFKFSIPKSAFSIFEAIAAIVVMFLGCTVLINYKAQKAFNPKKSVLVGVIHGLAGSGLILLAVVASSNTVISGISYILLFGLGSIIGMALASTVITLPLTKSKSQKWIKLTAGSAGVLIGCYMLFSVLLPIF